MSEICRPTVASLLHPHCVLLHFYNMGFCLFTICSVPPPPQPRSAHNLYCCFLTIYTIAFSQYINAYLLCCFLTLYSVVSSQRAMQTDEHVFESKQLYTPIVPAPHPPLSAGIQLAFVLMQGLVVIWIIKRVSLRELRRPAWLPAKWYLYVRPAGSGGARAPFSLLPFVCRLKCLHTLKAQSATN